jgi:activator of HSP90 ATPase
MNLINYSIKKLNVSNHKNSVVIVNPDATMMSSLTGGQSNSSSSSSTCSNSSKSSISTELTESAELKSCNSVTIEGLSDKNEAPTKSTFGQPKGSTVTYYLDLNEWIELATKEAAKQLEAEPQKVKVIKHNW